MIRRNMASDGLRVVEAPASSELLTIIIRSSWRGVIELSNQVFTPYPYTILITSDKGSLRYANSPSVLAVLGSTGFVHHLLSHQHSLRVKHSAGCEVAMLSRGCEWPLGCLY
jgi:hypothetical protein